MMTDAESPCPPALKTGRYRHFKGREYLVVGVAQHSETEEELVVYRPDYGQRELWVRPLHMFLESVELNGQTVPRFTYLGDDAEADPAAADTVGR